MLGPSMCVGPGNLVGQGVPAGLVLVPLPAWPGERDGGGLGFAWYVWGFSFLWSLYPQPGRASPHTGNTQPFWGTPFIPTQDSNG